MIEKVNLLSLELQLFLFHHEIKRGKNGIKKCGDRHLGCSKAITVYFWSITLCNSFGPSCFVKALETWTLRAGLIYAQFFLSNSRRKWGNLGDDMIDLKREQSQLKLKLNHLHDNVNIILEIMTSRQPIVKRI